MQSYTTRASKSSRNVEAFGEIEPVATIAGQRKYVLELTRLYATEDAISDGINFYELSDFSLVICKPDRKVIYSGCEWSDIQEEGQLNAMVAEKVTVVASNELRPRLGPWDELRPPTAGRLLYLWRASRDAAEEPMERSLLCNARVLAESCFIRGAGIQGWGRPCWSR